MSSMKRALNYFEMSALGLGKKVLNGTSFNKALNRAMAKKMTAMKGVPLKINQILGMSETESSELHLQAMENIEAMSLKTVEEILSKEAPQLLEGAQIDEGFLCASLGQVCHLVKDNQEFAVKLQYPESAENMNLDSKAMNLLTQSFGHFSRGFDMSEYNQVLKTELNQELDYQREIEMQHEFYRVFSDNKDIIIPLSMKKYSTKKCLVMSWEPSLSLGEFQAIASEELQKQAAKLFVDFYITSIFKFGLLHSDPNLGNFGFRIFGDKVQLVVYDFGSVVKLEKEKHLHLLSLFELCENGKNPLPALAALGFKKDLLEPIQDKLPALMSVLLEPFLAEGLYSFETWKRKEKVKDILGDGRWNFMTSAPADLFLFMRSLNGLFYYTEKLRGAIYCRPGLQSCLSFHSAGIQEIMSSYDLGSLALPVESSTYLIISVREDGAQKVKLTLPAKAIENLGSFIPPDVLGKLEKEKVSIEDLVRDVRRNAYKPQTVFSLLEDEKEISVYLE